jgi:hypothetical protein
MRLNPENLPTPLVSLIPWAEEWGIGDDHEREQKVARASSKERSELIACIDECSDEDLFGWLAGEESFREFPSREYLAVSNLVMAIDSARLKEQKKF